MYQIFLDSRKLLGGCFRQPWWFTFFWTQFEAIKINKRRVIVIHSHTKTDNINIIHWTPYMCCKKSNIWNLSWPASFLVLLLGAIQGLSNFWGHLSMYNFLLIQCPSYNDFLETSFSSKYWSKKYDQHPKSKLRLHVID